MFDPERVAVCLARMFLRELSSTSSSSRRLQTQITASGEKKKKKKKKKSFIISPPLLKSICVHLAITNHPSPLLLCLRIDWLQSIHSREREQRAPARTQQRLFKQASLQRKEKRSGNCCSRLEKAQGQTGKRPPHRAQCCEPRFGNESGRRCEGLTYWSAVGKWLWSLIGHMGGKEDCDGVYTW